MSAAGALTEAGRALCLAAQLATCDYDSVERLWTVPESDRWYYEYLTNAPGILERRGYECVRFGVSDGVPMSLCRPAPRTS